MPKMIKIRKTGEMFFYTPELAKRKDIDVVEVDDAPQETKTQAEKPADARAPRRARDEAPQVSVQVEGK